MDQHKFPTLVEALAAVPDPRKRRGQRSSGIFLLTLGAAALASGQQHGRAIGQWVQEHAAELRQSKAWRGRALPSGATVRRVLRHLGEPRPPAPGPPRWQGIARDGKERRGARTHGRVGHLVSLVRRDGDPEDAPLAQTTVADTSNEITAAPALQRGRTRRGQVVTVDALLAQQARAHQIRQQHGHSLRGIKENQPEVCQAIALLFAAPPAGVTAAESVVRPVDKGPGRLEWRTRETSAALADWLGWPGGRQVLRRTGRPVIVATGEVSEEVTDGMTSLWARQANAAVVERLWRGHWGIEIV